DNIIQDFKLTSEQILAFQIITTNIIHRNVFKDSKWIAKDLLVMFLTGPGGTGKTHVVRVIQKIMDIHGLSHGYRSVAPTANVASPINRTTLHSSCNIKIRLKNKLSRGISTNGNDLTILASVRKNDKLCQEWKDVCLLFIDEISMVDQILLSDVDASL
ncbi:hypothetical protein EV361DRAFT_762104, partial [Lentinula raphanica]